MKKIFKLLIILIVIFSFQNVSAKRVQKYFVFGCSSSHREALKYGVNLTHTGWYGVEITDVDVDVDGGIGSGEGELCTAPSSVSARCEFGCFEEALTSTNPQVIAQNEAIYNDFKADTGNPYCKMMCLPTNKFDYPGFAPVAEVGTKFTWTIGGSRGQLEKTNREILKLTVENECALVFDINSWIKDYNELRNIINQYRNLSYSKSVNCDSGYTYVKATNKSTKTVTEGSTSRVVQKEPSCSNDNYHYNESGDNCYVNANYVKELKSNAQNAAEAIPGLVARANACNNVKPSNFACGEASLTYDDEKYGKDIEIELEKTASTGVVNVTGWSGSAMSLGYYTYNSNLVASWNSLIYYPYRSAKFKSSVTFSIPDYVYRYVTNNGLSVFNYDEFSEKNTVEGRDSYYGRYKNVIDIGFPNFPVNFNSAIGEHKITVNFEFCGGTGSNSGKKVEGSCQYDVTDCPEGECPPPPTSDCSPGDPYYPTCKPPDDGINIIYRVIDLDNPFPGISGGGRRAGANWLAQSNYIKTFIENNRDVVTEQVYSLEPMYTIILTPADIRDIRSYNDTNLYNDFGLVCNDGIECRSKYLRTLYDQGVIKENSCGMMKDFYACSGIDKNKAGG